VNRVLRVIGKAGSRLALGAWLLAVWLLLWGRADGATVVSGVVVVAAAYGAARLPAAPVLTRIRPVRLAEAVLEFIADLLVSSVVVAWHAIRDPARVRGALIEVETRSRSELVLLAVTLSLTLRPGSVIIDIDTRRSTLLVHGLPVRDRDEAEEVRRRVLGTERRLMRALPYAHDADPAKGEDR